MPGRAAQSANTALSSAFAPFAFPLFGCAAWLLPWMPQDRQGIAATKRR
jgi:hypothetical protein